MRVRRLFKGGASGVSVVAMRDLGPGSSVWSPMRLVDFRYLLLGQVLTGMLGPLSFIVLAFWALERAPNGWEILSVGAVGTIRGASWLTLGLYWGALADRFDRRSVLLLVQILGMLLALVAAAIVFWIGGGALGLTLFYLTAFAFTALQPADTAVRSAVVAEMLGPRTQTGLGMMQVVLQGPALVLLIFSGDLIEGFGFGGAFLLMAGLHALNALALLPLTYRTAFERADASRRGGVRETVRQVVHDLRSGFRYARGDTVIFWSIAMIVASVAFTVPAFGNLGPVWVVEILDQPPSVFGRIAAPFLVSGTLTALVLTGTPFIEHKARLIVVGAFVIPAALLVFSIPQTVTAAFVAHFGLGASFTMTQVAALSLVEHRAPNEMRVRVMSLMQLSMGVAQLLTLPIAGLGQAVSLTTLFPAIGFISLGVVALIAAARPQVWRDRIPREADRGDARGPIGRA